MNHAEELYKLGIELKKNHGTAKVKCPKCSHTRKKKNDPCLYVNIDSGVYRCYNCDWKGSVAKSENMMQIQTNYTLPKVNNTNLSDESLAYCESRCISRATVIRWKLTESTEYYPQTGNNEKSINFNYLRENQVVNIKYRSINTKSFKLSANSELIFYGLDFIKDRKEVIITEGEFDALSFYEAGKISVVSVPNGAGGKNPNLKYLDNCIEYFENKEKIYLATDADEPGTNLAKELVRRLGIDKCWILSYPDGIKDANELLVSKGKESLLEAVKMAERVPLEGVFTCKDLKDRFSRLIHEGFPVGGKVGYDDFDELITWHTGQLTTVTGIPGSGKSEFIDWVLTKMMERYKWPIAIFSPENQPIEFHLAKYIEKITRQPLFIKSEYNKPTSKDIDNWIDIMNYYVFFIKAEAENLTLDGLLSKIKELIFRNGIRAAVIDPWNYIEHKIPAGYTETQYTSEALTKIVNFARQNDIHIFLVAHPVKIRKNENGKYVIPTLYDISGSAHFFNKTDNGISVYRDFETNLVTVYVQKIRFKHVGKLGWCDFNYDVTTGNYSCASSERGVNSSQFPSEKTPF